MSNYLDVGCTDCERFLKQEERHIKLRSAPFNRYEEGVFCGYYEKPSKEKN
jgi:hypothetical protein